MTAKRTSDYDKSDEDEKSEKGHEGQSHDIFFASPHTRGRAGNSAQPCICISHR